MHSRTTLAAFALSAALATGLFAEVASAEPLPDNERLRAGIALEGGGLFAPGVADLGLLGIQGQLGVQLDNLVGIYAAPSFGLVSGVTGDGFQIGGAILVDLTMFHVLTLGVGPEMTVFTTMGDSRLSGGLLYGARLHVGINPFVEISRRHARRRSLTLGLDLRLGTRGAGALSSSESSNELVATPTFTIGFQAF